jgi:hypothetical protein
MVKMFHHKTLRTLHDAYYLNHNSVELQEVPTFFTESNTVPLRPHVTIFSLLLLQHFFLVEQKDECRVRNATSMVIEVSSDDTTTPLQKSAILPESRTTNVLTSRNSYEIIAILKIINYAMRN